MYDSESSSDSETEDGVDEPERLLTAEEELERDRQIEELERDIAVHKQVLETLKKQMKGKHTLGSGKFLM